MTSPTSPVLTALQRIADMDPIVDSEDGHNDDEGKADCFRQCQEIARAVLAAAREALAGSEWEPIETAPKDGTAVLLISMAAVKPDPVIGHWSDDDGKFRDGYADDWYALAARGIRGWHDLASHWQPLPSSPQGTT